MKNRQAVLLAVSGGKDSMVMLHLFHSLGWPIGVGHIHHGLRQGDADEDAALVKAFCAKRHIPFFQYTIPQGALTGGNIQEKARDMRYAWLEKTAAENGYAAVATAHHATDSAETMLMHMLRGTGITGLLGIPAIRGKIVRPMLCFTGDEIESYAISQQIPYREDASNATDKYLRNRIRHHLLPVLEEIAPQGLQRLDDTRQHLQEANDALQHLAAQWIQNTRLDTHALYCLSKDSYISHPAGKYLLWYALKPFGFRKEQTNDMLSETHTPGKHWLSESHAVHLDRNTLTVTALTHAKIIPASGPLFPPGSWQLDDHQRISLQWLDPPVSFEADTSRLLVDADQVPLPLELRPWRAGDRIEPLGMEGKSQKVQDLLTNAKIPALQKNRVVVMTSGGKIVCIPGLRIAHWARITEKTTKILEISLQPIA